MTECTQPLSKYRVRGIRYPTFGVVLYIFFGCFDLGTEELTVLLSSLPFLSAMASAASHGPQQQATFSNLPEVYYGGGHDGSYQQQGQQQQVKTEYQQRAEADLPEAVVGVVGGPRASSGRLRAWPKAPWFWAVVVVAGVVLLGIVLGIALGLTLGHKQSSSSSSSSS